MMSGRSKRRMAFAVLGTAVLAATIWLADSSSFTIADGGFVVEAIVSSNKEVAALRYFGGHAAEFEALLEEDPSFFDWTDLDPTTREFAVDVRFSTRTTLIFGRQLHYVQFPSAIAVEVEFVDGSKEHRVVDLPRQGSSYRVVIQFD